MGILAILPLLSAIAACLFMLFFIVVPYLKVSSYKGRKDAVTYFFPIFGNLKLYFKDFAEKGDSMYSHKVFARDHPDKKFIVTNFSNKVLFVLQDPQYIREFLARPELYDLSQMAKIAKVLMGEGLLFAQGDQWKRHRKIISSCFNYEFLKSIVPLIQKITRESLDKIEPKDFKDCPAIKEMEKITAEVIGRIFFGEKLNDYTFRGKALTTSLAELTTELVNFARNPLAIFLGPDIMKMRFVPKVDDLMSRIEEFQEHCRKIVAEKKASKTDESNLISVLLKTQELNDPNERFSDREIVDVFITFFIAGMDTTGRLVGMALYMLTQHPEYHHKLQVERDQTYNQERDVTSETLQRMDFLHNVVKETLRMYSPGPEPPNRVAKQDHQIGDLVIRKGDLVKPMLITPQFNDKYVRDPDKFDPNRWNSNESRTMDPYAFIPFSAGPKNCIGQHLVILEAKVIISEFCEKFEFKIQDGFKLRMINRFLYEPFDDIRLVLTPREK